MTLYFDLKPNQIKADPELIGRVPYALATYYLALPLGRENGQVSVVMSNPNNERAVDVLGGLLEAEIIPVCSSAESISAAIERLYPTEIPHQPLILAWANSTSEAAAITDLLSQFGRRLNLPVTTLTASQLKLDIVLRRAHSGHYQLLGLQAPTNPIALNHLIQSSPIPLLLARGHYTRLQRILVVLRGYASDEHTLQLVAPLIQANQATATLLLLAESSYQPWSDEAANQHLKRCLHQFEVETRTVYLKFRQGEWVDQVAAEVAQGDYDLIVIAAEAHGQFVIEVLHQLDGQQLHANRPILIIKPPLFTA